MTTVFQSTVRSVLILAKCIGLINVCYAFDSTGSTVRYANKTYLKLVELTRMSVLLVCTYVVYQRKLYYMQKYDLLQFWACVITARMSTKWTIKLINDVMEFDRELASFSTTVPIREWSLSKKRWYLVVTVLVAYWAGLKIFYVSVWLPKDFDTTAALCCCFNKPAAMEITVVTSSWFFLENLDRRFQTLNDIVWKRLPAGLVAAPGQWTHSEIALALETVRLLHARLSELVHTFSMGFGPLLLNFFVLGFVEILFYSVFKIDSTKPRGNGFLATSRFLLSSVVYGQKIVFMTSTIVFASRVTDKKSKIVSYLRLCRISNLPVAIKLQVKMFMNQISTLESVEITAYGIFNFNMNLIISILILLIAGLSTLLQMRKHPMFLRVTNDSLYTLHNSFENVAIT